MSKDSYYTEHLYRLCESYDYLSFSREVDFVIDGLCPSDYDLNFSSCATPDGILYSAFIIVHLNRFDKE